MTGEGPSRNMYKGHMDKAKGGRFECGSGDRRGGGRGIMGESRVRAIKEHV